MISKPLAAGLLAVGCLTAAAGGAYVATRSNAAEGARVQQAVPAAPTDTPAQPVSETEGIIAPRSQDPAALPEAEARPETTPNRQASEAPLDRSRASGVQRRADAPRNTRPPSAAAARPTTAREPSAAQRTVTAERPAVTEERPTASDHNVPPVAPAEAPAAEPRRAAETPVARTPEFEELVVPASSVIGLQVQSSVSSERARVEDRIEARVTRDVMAGNSVAIPAGARVLGTVTAIERGGKIKERARLDVRFHTLVLADGTELPMRTETISRFGESPTGDSARKIGGAAVGGAILGAIMGGGKGAMIGGATGAAGGTAVVMAGDRNAATLAAGTILSVRLTNPVSIEVEK